MTEFITVGSLFPSTSAEVQKAFRKLEDAVQDGVLRPVVVAVGKLMAASMRSEAPQDSGLMRQAIGTSAVRTYSKQGNLKLLVAVGVRRGYRRAVTPKRGGGTRRRSKAFTAANPETEMRNPAKYLHLVHGGRGPVTVRTARTLYSAASNNFFGQDVAAAKSNDFAERGFASNCAEAVALAKSIGSTLVTDAVNRLSISK